jgi:hypothetical protein
MRIRENTSDLREQLIKRLRPRGMRISGTCPRALHDSKHAAILAIGKPQVTQPHRATSQVSVVVLSSQDVTMIVVVGLALVTAVVLTALWGKPARRRDALALLDRIIPWRG